jgi:tRNA G18 (ribose-2'-O)-methylase SpoU
MAFIIVESARDSRLSGYRAVTRPRELAARGVFAAESRLVVERVLGDRRYEIESILVNDAAQRALAPVLANDERDVPVYVVLASVMRELTGHDFHRGCVALVRRPRAVSFVELTSHARSLLVLDGVADPDNVGAVFRSAAAFGVDAVVLGPGTGDPLYRKAIRTSVASTLRVPFARLSGPAWPVELGRLRERGFELVALTPREPALDIEEYRARCAGCPIALLVGSEGAGLCEAVLELADYRVRIPMVAEVDSLNLAVAAGIALARLVDVRRAR